MMKFISRQCRFFSQRKMESRQIYNKKIICRKSLFQGKKSKTTTGLYIQCNQPFIN